jgi:hypothetical protein
MEEATDCKNFQVEHGVGASVAVYRWSATCDSLCWLSVAACFALFSCTAVGAEWPPNLNPDPNVQPPKWDWQLALPVQVNPDTTIKIYDIDMLENENSGAVQALHNNGYKVICYVDVGTWEIWRDDATTFPATILGATYSGFPDERWLDIRDVNPQKSNTGTALATILASRFNRARNMGCDAIEADNMDGYDTSAHQYSGFPLTYDDQIYFNLWVANTVHSLTTLSGDVMLVGLKNDINQAHDPQIYTAFDFLVSEECFQYNECGYYSDFLALNKPVFDAEYHLALGEFCPEAKASRISAIKKVISLNSYREDCSAYYAEVPDTDGDGLPDTVETNTGTYNGPTNTGTNPNVRDTDGDGLDDGAEVNTHGTNPTLRDSDSDGDGFGDGVEQGAGTNPNSPAGPWPAADGDLAPLNVYDGVVDVGDVVVAERMALGLVPQDDLDERAIAHGDLATSGTSAGVIDTADVLLILQQVLNGP